MSEILADDVCIDDRRRVVNAGVRHGRDAEIANLRALADIGIRSVTSDVIAIRGERLFLGRHRVWGGDQRPEAFYTRFSASLEIDAEDQIVARVLFDSDDIDAAFTELDARYLAGEAADLRTPVVGYCPGLRRVQPARTSGRAQKTSHCRSPAGLPRSNPGTMSEIIRDFFGTSHQTSLFGSRRCIVSASSERSSPMCNAWDVD